MSVQNYESRFYQANHSEKRMDSLTVEEALQIDVNETTFAMTMRSPGDDQALVRGILHSEGVIKDPFFSPDVIIRKENEKGVITKIEVRVPKNKIGEGLGNSRNLLSVSSCGICGKTSLEERGFMDSRLEVRDKITIDKVHQAFDKMAEVQDAFKSSGGSHAAAAFDWQGNLLCFAEDIGRHNAVDKVTGKLLLEDQYKQAALLTVSGRISYEIVIKSFKSRIPILAAVSAPSSLAVDYSKELGLTLLAFCRGDRATCYANTERIDELNHFSVVS